MPDDICVIGDCARPVHNKTRSWCRMHYERWKTHGDPLTTLLPRDRKCDVKGCERKHKCGGLCDLHYQRYKAHGHTDITSYERGRGRETVAELIAEPSIECIEWPYSRNTRGYGQVESTLSHRMAYEIANDEPIPVGMMILHSCDNPPCCNPRHLRVGTQQENMQDAYDRNRFRHGSNHYAAALTESDITQIRTSELSNRDLAEMYGVSERHIRKIINRKAWRHVD